MQDEVKTPGSTAYAYPLLIKQLLLTPFVQAQDEEIVYRDQFRMTYATLRERIARLANGLSQLGVQHGRLFRRSDDGRCLADRERASVPGRNRLHDQSRRR